MPLSPSNTVLCRFGYDPLDRQVDCAPSATDRLQRFYCKTRLASETQGAVHRSIFQHDDQLLAQQLRQNGKVDTTLLATDQQRSVINALDAAGPHPLALTPYGHRPPENGLLSLLAFNGERPDPLTGHYHLGNGYRQFNPVLMRFNSSDSLSPFSDGGLNAYAYCVGDPVNRSDPTGKISILSIITGVSGVVGAATFVGSLLVEDETLAWTLSGISMLASGIAIGGGLASLRKTRQPQRTGSVQSRGNRSASIPMEMDSLPPRDPGLPPAYFSKEVSPPAPGGLGLDRFSNRQAAYRSQAQNPNPDLSRYRPGGRPNGSPASARSLSLIDDQNPASFAPDTRRSSASSLASNSSSIRNSSR